VSLVLSGKQVAVEEPLQIGKINAVDFNIRAALPLIPGVYGPSVYAIRICFKRAVENLRGTANGEKISRNSGE
jgi:hypothetical protein